MGNGHINPKKTKRILMIFTMFILKMFNTTIPFQKTKLALNQRKIFLNRFLFISLSLTICLNSCKKDDILNLYIFNFSNSESCGHGYENGFVAIKFPKKNIEILKAKNDYCKIADYPCIYNLISPNYDTFTLHYSYKMQKLLPEVDSNYMLLIIDNPTRTKSSIKEIELKMTQFLKLDNKLYEADMSNFRVFKYSNSLVYHYYFNNNEIDKSSPKYTYVMKNPEGFAE